MYTEEDEIEEKQELARQEAHTRASEEARELARDDVRQARLYGAAAESHFQTRLNHHYEELSQSIHERLTGETE